MDPVSGPAAPASTCAAAPPASRQAVAARVSGWASTKSERARRMGGAKKAQRPCAPPPDRRHFAAPPSHAAPDLLAGSVGLYVERRAEVSPPGGRGRCGRAARARARRGGACAAAPGISTPLRLRPGRGAAWPIRLYGGANGLVVSWHLEQREVLEEELEAVGQHVGLHDRLEVAADGRTRGGSHKVLFAWRTEKP